MNSASIETLFGIGARRSPKFHPFLSVGRNLKLPVSKKYRTSPTVQFEFDGKPLPVVETATFAPALVYCGLVIVPVTVLPPEPSIKLAFPALPPAPAPRAI